MVQFTPTERQIIDVLKDGLPHRKAELMALMDELAEPTALQNHLSRMRKKLAPRGYDIVLQVTHQRNFCYRLVIRVASFDE